MRYFNEVAQDVAQEATGYKYRPRGGESPEQLGAELLHQALLTGVPTRKDVRF
jgi:hypothetical protein